MGFQSICLKDIYTYTVGFFFHLVILFTDLIKMISKRHTHALIISPKCNIFFIVTERWLGINISVDDRRLNKQNTTLGQAKKNL